jgi:uncharacterized membrane protein
MSKRKSRHKARAAATAGEAPRGEEPKGGAPKGGAPKGGGKPPLLKRRSVPNWPVLALALVGMALAGYLAITGWLHRAPAFCTEGSGCDAVQSSRWGAFLGLPTAAWGFLAYAALAHIAFRVRNAEWHWKLSWLIALSGLAVSVYLTVISLTVIKATCFYCLTSLVLMGALFVVIALQRPAGLPRFSWPVWVGETALVVLIAVTALHLHYGGFFDASMGPEDPWLRGLAEHLSQTGATFYGAYW